MRSLKSFGHLHQRQQGGACVRIRVVPYGGACVPIHVVPYGGACVRIHVVPYGGGKGLACQTKSLCAW